MSKTAIKLFTVAALAAAMWACSDDDDDPVQLEVNNGVSSVSINRLGGEISVPITSNGSWTVSIDDEENDWAGTLVAEGNGNGTAVISVDYFFPEEQKAERTVSFTVKTADNSSKLNVRQYIGLNDGEEAPNDNQSGLTDAWFHKKLGLGFDPTTGETKPSVVFVAESLDKYSNGTRGQFINVEKYAEGKNSVITTDTLESNDKSFHAHLSINVKFAKFKLNIDGGYDNSGKQVENKKTYCVSQEHRLETATAIASNIAGCLDFNPTFNPKNDDGLAAGIIQWGFKNAYKQVVGAYGDDNKFQMAVKKLLIGRIGPLVVTGTTLGGSIFTAIEYDSVAVANDMKITGVVDGNVKIAAVTINAKVDATYTSLGNDIWKNSNHKCTVTGGSDKTIKALMSLVREDEIDRTAYNKAVDDWLGSLSHNSESTDNAATITLQLTPIWYFFPFEMQDDIRDIVIDYYKGKTLCVDLENDFTTYEIRH